MEKDINTGGELDSSFFDSGNGASGGGESRGDGVESARASIGGMVGVRTSLSGDQSMEEVSQMDHSTDQATGPIPTEPLSDFSNAPSRDANTMPTGVNSDDDKRLVMTRMVLENFKSYYGRVEIGPFHTQFTSIVGPNGSGKSNVIDALLFVFGFKAKKLRQGKLGELVHASKDHEVDSCCVEIYFKVLNDPDQEEFVVSRSVKKSNDTSSYYINGRASTYKKVQEMLKSYGIDLDHKRFLILQGEVEQIALMKPKATTEHDEGLLEYLEDIIGTNKYKPLIEEANEELNEKSNVHEMELQKFKIVQQGVNSLKESSEEALDFLRNENQLTFVQNKLLQLRKMNLGKSIGELEEKIESKTKELDQINAQMDKDESNVLSEQLEKLSSELNNIKKDLKARNAKLSEHERLEIESKEAQKQAQQKLKKKAKQLVADKQKQMQDKTWIGNFDQDVQKATDEKSELNQKLEKEMEALEEIQQSLGKKTQVYQKQIEEKQVELAPWLDKMNVVSEKKNELEAELNLLQSKVENGKRAVEDATNNEKQNREGLKDLKSNLAECEENVKLYSQKVAKEQKEIAKHEQELSSRKSQLQKEKLEYQDLKQRTLTNRNESQTYKAIMGKKKDIPGIHDRLGNLGNINKKYDVAITTACPALNHIVVSKVEDAQATISFLKQSNTGRANFLCMDKIAKSIPSVKTPEDVPRLVDLIECDEVYRGCFYHSLGDTVVVNDLEQAKRVAYGAVRFRVVTLDGEVIEKSGAVSGGGNRVLKGGMSDKVEKYGKTVSEMEDLINESEARIEESEKIINLKKRDLQNYSKLLQENEGNLERLLLEIASVEREIEDCVNALAIAKKNSIVPKEDLSRITELEKLVAVEQANLEKLQSSCKSIQDDIKSLQDTIMEIGGVKLRLQKAKVDSINEQIEMISKSLLQLKAEKQTREKHLKKSFDIIAKTEEEITELEQSLEELKNAYQQLSDNVEAVKQEIRELDDLQESKEEEVADLKKEIAEKTAEANKIRALQVELTSALKKLKAVLGASRQKLEDCEESLKNLNVMPTGFEDDVVMLDTYTPEELSEMNEQKLSNEYDALKAAQHGKQPNLSVLNEYRTKLEKLGTHSKLVEQCTAELEVSKQLVNEYRKARLDEFMTGFRQISQKLKEMYKMITMGGNAELELVDSLDPFSEGVLFSVMPPKKSWKNISNLSGGEKTLSSLALVFALHHYKPTPIYVMDEIDAALDFRNVSIIANYIKQRTKNAQFCIISLRNNMFEMADRLVGIYKTFDKSKSITIEPTIVENAMR